MGARAIRLWLSRAGIALKHSRRSHRYSGATSARSPTRSIAAAAAAVENSDPGSMNIVKPHRSISRQAIAVAEASSASVTPAFQSAKLTGDELVS